MAAVETYEEPLDDEEFDSEDNEQCADGADTLQAAVEMYPPRTQPPRVLTGPIGPPVPDSSRRRSMPLRRQQPTHKPLAASRRQGTGLSDLASRATTWTARAALNEQPSRTRHIPGNPNYTGCHNCGSLEHLARHCEKPVTKQLASLIEQGDMTLDDAEVYVMQGVHPDIFGSEAGATLDQCAALVLDEYGMPPWYHDDVRGAYMLRD